MPACFKLYHDDCMNVLKGLPDNSVDLVVTDPPYYKVKANAWDNQWDSEADFLAWLDEVLFELYRVLKPNGSLYLFCSPQLSAETELLIKARLKVLNHIVWRKQNGRHNAHCKERLRAFATQSERIIFAEHYGADGYAKGSTGYTQKKDAANAKAYQPVIDYFRQARAALGVSAKAIDAATDTQMCSHWFSDSQWKLPTREQYQTLQGLFAQQAQAQGLANPLNRDHDELARELSVLHGDYHQLRTEFERARRYFSVTKEVPFTDVWDFAPVPYYPGKHPCEKPAAMAEHIITTSSRHGDTVLDPFFGSGAFGKAAL